MCRDEQNGHLLKNVKENVEMMKIKVSCGNERERGDVTEILLALYGKGYQCKVKNPKKQGKYQRVYIEAYRDYEPARPK